MFKLSMRKISFVFAVLILPSCLPTDEQDDNTGSEGFIKCNWLSEFVFDSDYSSDKQTFYFTDGTGYDKLPVYLFNQMRLNAYETPVLSDWRSELISKSFSFYYNWDLGDAAVNYSDRKGSINVTGAFKDDNTIEYIKIITILRADVNTSSFNGELTENFVLDLTDVPFTKTEDEIMIELDAAFLENNAMVSYDSYVPMESGTLHRVLDHVNWDNAKLNGLALSIKLSVKS